MSNLYEQLPIGHRYDLIPAIEVPEIDTTSVRLAVSEKAKNLVAMLPHAPVTQPFDPALRRLRALAPQAWPVVSSRLRGMIGPYLGKRS